MKNLTIIFRTINACNLNCKYCYDKNNHYNIKKENEKIEKKIEEIIRNVNKLLVNKETRSEFIFHGGEPLLVAPKTYEKIMQGLKRNNPKLKFSIQTNGTLISTEFIKLFKKYNVHIGISLDGYNEEQNEYRVDHNGQNVFYRVLNIINLLKENDIKFGIIMSLSKNCIGHEKELYEFISKNSINCNLRPIFGNEDIMMTNKEYYTFFTNLFNIWLADTKSKVSLRQITEMYNIFRQILDKKFQIKMCSKTCNCFENFISLDIYGNLYSCNRTYNKNEFYYGNINDLDINTLKSEMKKRTEKRIKIVKSKCINCKLYSNCKGGCPANAFEKYGNIYGIDDYYCKAKIKIYNYVYNVLKNNGMIIKYKERKLVKYGKKNNFI